MSDSGHMTKQMTKLGGRSHDQGHPYPAIWHCGPESLVVEPNLACQALVICLVMCPKTGRKRRPDDQMPNMDGHVVCTTTQRQ
jgi:hypothetical protein